MTPAGDVIPVTLVVGWIGGSAWQAALGMARKLPEAVLLHPFTSERSLRCEAYQLDEVVSFRSPGCACCAQRSDLIDRLSLLARRRRRPRHVVVAGLPGADAATAVLTLLGDSELARTCELNGVVACFEHGELGTGDNSSQTDLGAAMRAQSVQDSLLLADMVWVRMAAPGTPPPSVVTQARSLNPCTRVRCTPRPPPATQLAALHAWSPPAITRRLRHEDESGAGVTADPLTGSAVLKIDRPLIGDRVDQWISDLHGSAGLRLLRIEGELWIDGQPASVIVSGCRTTLTTTAGRPFHRTDRMRSRLRLCGHELDLRDLSATLEACAV